MTDHSNCIEGVRMWAISSYEPERVCFHKTEDCIRDGAGIAFDLEDRGKNGWETNESELFDNEYEAALEAIVQIDIRFERMEKERRRLESIREKNYRFFTSVVKESE